MDGWPTYKTILGAPFMRSLSAHEWGQIYRCSLSLFPGVCATRQLGFLRYLLFLLMS
jgi:hypothetical protein